MERRVELSSGHEIWTKTVGGGPRIPLLLLHGGPGGGHDYLEPLEALSSDRPVIFYDQLGCGKSDMPKNRALWTIERFADEVQEVRDALGLERCHMLGQSWGGWLGIEYMLRQPAGLQSFVLASTSASVRKPCRLSSAKRSSASICSRFIFVLVDLGVVSRTLRPSYWTLTGSSRSGVANELRK